MQTDDRLFWFVAYTKPLHEKKAAECLEKLGIDHYLAVQTVRRKWSDRTKKIGQLVIPHIIFIHTTQAKRIGVIKNNPHLSKYMCDRGTYHPVIVPDRQLEDFRFMVQNGKSEVKVSPALFKPGDQIVVTQGALKGLECQLIEVDGKNFAVVQLSMLGSASVEISLDSIRKA